MANIYIIKQKIVKNLNKTQISRVGLNSFYNKCKDYKYLLSQIFINGLCYPTNLCKTTQKGIPILLKDNFSAKT